MSGERGERRLRLAVPPHPKAVATAREAVDDALYGVAPPDVRSDVRLLVSELVTNSIRHAGLNEDDRVEVEASASPEIVHVEVRDPGSGFEPEVAMPQGESGWGLRLVQRLADRWGVTRDEATNVWFEMRTSMRRHPSQHAARASEQRTAPAGV